jgi:endonuclease-8
MPEGDTLARIAVALRPYLAGRVVTAARARLPGPQVSRIVGQKIDAVDAAGKNLLIKFDGGLELRTHLGLHGSWHRYRPGETWRRPPSRAALVIEVPGAIAVCFDAPVVELFERRAEIVHPTISMLGPDLLDASYDQAEAVRRLRDPARAATAIGEAVLDQRAVAGIGNVFKSEILFIEKVDPFAVVGTLDEPTIDRILSTAHEHLKANARPEASASRTTTVDLNTGKRLAPSRLWVYDRAGRPCHRCGTLIVAGPQGTELPRTTYWCPSCQAPAGKPAAKSGAKAAANAGSGKA